MIDDDKRMDSAAPTDGLPLRPEPGPAERALAEAEARRTERRRTQHALPREVNGRQGPEPVRYGDWENKGIASDF